ncbi:peptidoglycan DD-metalloendopeptidase family protein [Nocardioides sp. TRM66260-LWL]|uniref:peptidoglycan DD-metalloendopeptidase family protein n=1 Tax=Nocardioides sp. TRM66260-LWL TaxID=2874478 RepID=UPI001CC6AEFB|nr:M23 family metallopeptidase [Nocardioides sp. TRM66260-LWL]MBZ5732910.1 peptidoglycan DD-metalloendopeptidase family protein [Nocardioides sp. TRM66260-LWL]
MRLFPGAVLLRSPRLRILATLTALALLLGAVALPLANAKGSGDLKDRRKQVQSQIRGAQQDLDESSGAARRAALRVKAAEQRLAAARQRLSRITVQLAEARREDERLAQRLAVAQQRLADAQAALAEGKRAVARQRTQVSETITSYYELGDPRLRAFATLLDSADAEELTRRDSLGDVVVERESGVYDDLVATERDLAAREGKVEAATAEVADERAAAARNLERVTALRARAKTAEASVQQLVAERSAQQRRAAAAAAADRRVLARLKAREERIRKQILAQQRRASGNVRAGDGFLTPPVNGPITSPFGYRIHPIYGYYGLHDGTDFGVSCGEPMKAAGNGIVTQRFSDAVYGNRLYVSLGSVNGKNLTVVYNHASGYRVNVGERVTRGETVGWVGDTGWSTGCHLHFTVLENGTPVDPEKWL